MPKHAKQTKVTRDEAMIEALPGLEPNQRRQFPPALGSVEAVVARYQEHLDAVADVRAKEIAWRVAVERERQLEAELQPLHARVTLVLRGFFGSSSTKLQDFGVRPQKTPHTPIEVKARAVERRLETRRLRGTIGKKQRKRIKAKGG
jgi:hypothetical protein